MTAVRTPVLVGAGQITQRDVEPAAALDPLALMAAAAGHAAADAGGGPQLLAALDSITVVRLLSWDYGNPPRLLAERLGAHPTEERSTTMGGNTPQWLVHETATRIAAGQVRLALIAGAEAMRTVRRARRAGIALDWARAAAPAPTVVGDPRAGSSAFEVAHGLQLPVQIYPLFENARRAHAGRDLALHQQDLGRLMSRLSAVAATHPHA